MSTPDERAKALAQIAMDIPRPPTHGDLLLALHKAYEAGEHKGFAEGMVTGQKQLMTIQDALLGAMSR
jgi:hypothetical protein